MKAIYLHTISLFLLLGFTVSDLIRLPLKKIHKTTLKNEVIASEETEIQLETEVGDLPIINDEGIAYTVIVDIGSQKQAFLLQIDTGSGDLWVPDVTLAAALPGTDTFDCSSSTTCKAFPSDDQTLEYGSGNIEVFKITDQVDIGGLVIPNFPMNLATNLGDIPMTHMDGIMGMSLGRDADNNPTVLEELVANNLIDVAAFSIFVSTEQDGDGNYIGEFIIGGHDPKYADGEFQFVNVLSVTPENPFPYWMAPMLAFGFGERNLTTFTSVNAIFDSGTTEILLPLAMLNELLEDIANRVDVYESESGYEVYCSVQDQLPRITVYFEGASLSIPPSSYLLPADSIGEACVLGFDTLQGDNDGIVLGDTFLKNYYTLFTASNHTVGFAKSVLSNKGTTIDLDSTTGAETSTSEEPTLNSNDETSYGSNISWFMALIALIVLVL